MPDPDPELAARALLAWRVGFQPQLTDAELAILRAAAVQGDPELAPGEVASGPGGAIDWFLIPERACALGYCLWRGRRLGTVGEVREEFCALHERAQALLYGAGAAPQSFTHWHDTAPFDLVLGVLAAECDAELARRRGSAGRTRSVWGEEHES